MQHILDSMPDAVVVVKPDGLIEFSNLQAENWFDYGRNELVGQSIEILIPEKLRNKHKANREHYLQTSAPRLMGSGLDLYARRKDGSELAVDISIGPLSINGEPHFIAVVRDITERRKLEYERDEATHAREEILGMVSHDLKTPLTAILLNLQLAPRVLAGAWNPSVQKWVNRMSHAADQMNHLMQDVLTAEKVKAGTFNIEKQPHSVATLISNILELLGPIAERKSIILEKKIPDEPLNVRCDQDRILQVLSNLLGNAIKFTAEGGRIGLEVVSRQKEIEFCVWDTGPGITKENLPQLFDRYWQAKKTARMGTGLGLYIVKTVVEAHGGRVWVESSLGNGSRFFFSLPLTDSKLA